MYSNTLHVAKDSAIGLKNEIEFALGIGITLKSVQVSGILFDLNILFKIERRRSSALIGKLRNIIGDNGPCRKQEIYEMIMLNLIRIKI